MSSASPAMIPTRDSQAHTPLKTPAGVVNLPVYEAQNSFIHTKDVAVSYSANVAGTWSGYSEISLDSLPSIVDKLTLSLTIANVTATGGTYQAFVNGGQFFSRMIQVYIGSELIHTLYPESGYIESIVHSSDEKKVKLLHAAGNNPQAVRRAAVAASQVLLVNLNVPLLMKYGWFTKQTQGVMKLKIYHQDLPTILQTDSTAPVAPITSVALLVSGREYHDANNVVALINMQKKLGSVATRFLEPLQMQSSLSSGSSTYTVQLNNIIGNVAYLFFIVRESVSVSTALANYPDLFQPISTFDMRTSSGDLMLTTQTTAYNQSTVLAKYVSGTACDYNSGAAYTDGVAAGTQKNIYMVSFCSDPEAAKDKGVQNGFQRFTGLEKLTLNFPATTTQAYVCDVVAYVWNQVVCDSNGAIKKMLI